MHPQEYVKIWSEVKGSIFLNISSLHHLNLIYLTLVFPPLCVIVGKPAKYSPLPVEEFAKLPFPGAQELAEMFAYFEEYTYYGHHDFSLGRKASPHLKTWRQYLEQGGL